MKHFLYGFGSCFCILAPFFIAILILAFVIGICGASIENKALETENAVLKTAIEEHR